MKTALLAAAAAVLLAAASLHAEDVDPLQAVRQDLQSARAHLKAAPHEYAGHRKQALDLVDRALAQVEQGIKVGDRRDVRDEKTVKHLEHRQEKLGNQIEKLKGEPSN